MYDFHSQASYGDYLPDFTQNEIKNEPMMFSASLDFAREHAGPITRAFLDHLEAPKNAIFDSRSHMLMPGWWPCIPGWHHDDIPRSRSDGQPDYDNPSYLSNHCMVLVNGDICPTLMALGDCRLSEVPIGQTIYEVWDAEISALVEKGDLRSMPTESNRMTYFNWQTIHGGQQAKRSGWRWFGRASWNTERKFFNEVRHQVQVYLPFPKAGW